MACTRYFFSYNNFLYQFKHLLVNLRWMRIVFHYDTWLSLSLLWNLHFYYIKICFTIYLHNFVIRWMRIALLQTLYELAPKEKKKFFVLINFYAQSLSVIALHMRQTICFRVTCIVTGHGLMSAVTFTLLQLSGLLARWPFAPAWHRSLGLRWRLLLAPWFPSNPHRTSTVHLVSSCHTLWPRVLNSRVSAPSVDVLQPPVQHSCWLNLNSRRPQPSGLLRVTPINSLIEW